MVASQDVEMEVVENVEDPETVKKDADANAVQEIREHIKQIEKAVSSKEPRFILRVLRGLPNTRRKLNPVVLRSLASQIYPAGAERDAILVFVENLPAGSVETEVPKPRAIIKTPIPEVDAYYQLLALVRLLDSELLDKALNCGRLNIQISLFSTLFSSNFHFQLNN
jgi:26S proteasome regulatory subunit N3